MGSNSPRSVAVIVPTYNRAALLGELLESLEVPDLGGAEVIVVSDGSTDATEAVVEQFGRRLERTDRAGAAGARNRGWRATDAEIVAFVDDDCVTEPGWLGHLVAPFADPAVGLVQGRTRPAGPVGPTDRTIDVYDENGLYESCNIAYRREALVQVAGFDETLHERFPGRPFGEDTDLAWRVRRRGWRTAFAGDAVVRHHVFAGTYGDLLREEWRKGRFPQLMKLIPELRDLLPGGRHVLRRQSAPAQLALAGIVVATVRPRAGLAMTLPYGAWLVRRHRAPRAAARQAGRDLVCSVALVTGSVRARSLLL